LKIVVENYVAGGGVRFRYFWAIIPHQCKQCS